MDKRMNLREELVGLANSSTNHGYHGEQVEVRSSDKEIAMDPLENVHVDFSQNAIPFLEVSEITNTETRVGITVLENAKMDDTEDVITENSSPENFDDIATENGSGSGTDVHICKRCGKSFSKIISLHGHMGSHLREDDYKLIRQICGPPVPEESSEAMAGSLPISNKKKKKPNKLKHIWKASMALVEMSMAPVWQPKHDIATIDLSASVTCSSDEHGSGDEAAKMSEVAEFLTILVKRIQEETAKVPSPPSVQCYVCKICSKTFSSYQALGGHMSIHNKQKNILLEDGSGSSIGSGVDCTLKYACTICNEKIPTKKSLGEHKRKHYYQENKKAASSDGNVKPAIQLAQDLTQSSGPRVLPTDKNMTLPVLLWSNSMPQPTRKEKVVANATVDQPLPLVFDAMQLAPQSKKLRNDTEL